MSLNARIALLAGFALLLAPIWLPLSPFVVWWWRDQRRAGRALGFTVLTARQAQVLEAHAEATLPTPPAGGWRTVAHNVDRYLAAVHSPRHWRTLAVLTLLEFAPLLRGQAPLTKLPVDRRRAFLERHMATTRGLLAIPALARQLVRMGYYTDAGIAASLGFRPMRQRRQAPLAALHAAATSHGAARKAVG